MQNLIDRRLRSYFADLKQQTMSDNWKMRKQFNTIVHNANQKLRDYFMHWKAQSDKETCVIENNEAGPLAEEVFDYQ